MNEIKLEKENAIIINEIKNGCNGLKFKVLYQGEYYFLKISEFDYDNELNIAFMPKLYEKGKTIYNGIEYYYRLYYLVNGKCLKKNYFLTNEMMIQMIEFEIMLHQKGFSLVDIQLDNFMIDKNNRVFYIDYGGIEDINTAYSKFHKPYYDTLVEPEETKGKMDDVIPNYNEQIEIFYYGLFLKESFCILNNKINNVVSKMIEFKCFSRYKHFTEIINDL